MAEIRPGPMPSRKLCRQESMSARHISPRGSQPPRSSGLAPSVSCLSLRSSHSSSASLVVRAIRLRSPEAPPFFVEPSSRLGFAGLRLTSGCGTFFESIIDDAFARPCAGNHFTPNLLDDWQEVERPGRFHAAYSWKLTAGWVNGVRRLSG